MSSTKLTWRQGSLRVKKSEFSLVVPKVSLWKSFKPLAASQQNIFADLSLDDVQCGLSAHQLKYWAFQINTILKILEHMY